MCEIFNRERYWERLQTGEFNAVVLEEHIPQYVTPTIPAGSRSQMISYRDADDNEVARVHQYLTPNGIIGASGKPDPKRLLYEGVLYRLHKKSSA